MRQPFPILNSPPPDGRITLAAIKSAAEWQRLEELPEEFFVPPDFVIPDDQFHTSFLRALKRTDGSCIVLTGPPGIGKSTYISNLYQELNNTGIHVIRHHYFLSRDDRTNRLRYDHISVARSLMSEIQAISDALGIAQPSGNPRAEDLLGWLSACGRELSQRGSRLVVILDGLDHVWNEEGSVRRTEQTVSARNAGSWRSYSPPPLEYPAVRRWAEIHVADLRAVQDGEPIPHMLDEIAGALWRRSEGYPLHLRYLLKSL